MLPSRRVADVHAAFPRSYLRSACSASHKSQPPHAATLVSTQHKPNHNIPFSITQRLRHASLTCDLTPRTSHLAQHTAATPSYLPPTHSITRAKPSHQHRLAFDSRHSRRATPADAAPRSILCFLTRPPPPSSSLTPDKQVQQVKTSTFPCKCPHRRSKARQGPSPHLFSLRLASCPNPKPRAEHSRAGPEAGDRSPRDRDVLDVAFEGSPSCNARAGRGRVGC